MSRYVIIIIVCHSLYHKLSLSHGISLSPGTVLTAVKDFIPVQFMPFNTIRLSN